MKYKLQYNIGKVKYVVSYSDGTKKHKNGSEFWDVAIFKSKKKMNEFIASLQDRPEKVKYSDGRIITYYESELKPLILKDYIELANKRK